MNSETAKQRLERVKNERESRRRRDGERSLSTSQVRRHSHKDDKKAKEQECLLLLQPDLQQVLTEISLQHYASVFLQNNITSKQDLLALSDSRLKSFGVSGRSRAKIFEYNINTHSNAEKITPQSEPVTSQVPTPARTLR
eukprot:TRINITY_DN1331_c0_g1_i3.p1 TRINITY_DN1331_c0_g1~~TRINITY_DN1331_c0_g1_i3.p1  ORF type:complete len:155 (+),score=36.86 TRINITY_DN1331_c0_g1_i3:47-466(+)